MPASIPKQKKEARSKAVAGNAFDAGDVSTWLSTGGLSVTQELVIFFSDTHFAMFCRSLNSFTQNHGWQLLLVGFLQMAEMNVFPQKGSLRADEMRSVNEEREEENGWQIILPFVFVFVFVFAHSKCEDREEENGKRKRSKLFQNIPNFLEP